MGYVFFISEICTGRFSDIHISPETGLSDAGGASRKAKARFHTYRRLYTSRSITSGDKAKALKLKCRAPILVLYGAVHINEIIGSNFIYFSISEILDFFDFSFVQTSP